MISASPSTLPRLYALGVELNTAPDKFGFMRETAVGDQDMTVLRERMEEEGYLFLRGLRPRAEVQTARDSLTAQLERLQFLRPGFPRDEARFAGREVGRAMGNPLDQQDPAVRELLFGESMLAFFANFLGGSVRHFDFIWYRTKGPGLGSPLHCDLVYMGRGTTRLYTLWVPLGEVPLDMGGLMLLEESHRKSAAIQAYLSRDVDTYCANHDDAADYAEGRKWWDGTLSKNPLALQESLGGRWLTAENFHLGDAVLFNMTLVHGSLDNTTDRIRLSTDTRYQLASEPADERWIGLHPPGHTNAMKRGRVC